MKLCVTSNGNSENSTLDQRFGRAPYFVFVDTETMIFESAVNEAATSGGGSGITSGQLLIDKGVEALITGNVGPNAMKVLRAANIKIYKGMPVSVKENVEKFKKGLLEKINTSGPSHFGMGMNN